MSIRRKSLHRSANAKRWKKRANQRAAKERKRIECVMREEPMPDVSGCYVPPLKMTGFRITIECLDDSERTSFKTMRGPFGLTISPTACAEKLRVLLSNYEPVKP